MADLRALGLIEHYPRITEMGTESCVIRVNAGRSFAAGDLALIEWGDSPENVSDNFIETPVDLEGYVKGDVIVLPTDGLTEGEGFYYRLRITAGGVGHDGDIIGPVLAGIAPSDQATICLFGNSIQRHVNRFGPNSRIDMIQQTMRNIIDDAPHFVMGLGNNLITRESVTNIYPTAEDGTPAPGANSKIIVSQADHDTLCRLLQRDMAEMMQRAPFHECEGDYNGRNPWLDTAVNGGVTAALNWSIESYNDHFGNWANSDKWEGDPDGRWGSIQIGPVLLCVLSTQMYSELFSSDPATLPLTLDEFYHMTMGQPQWAHFLDATTGRVTLANPAVTPFILFVASSIIGGTSTVSPSFPYGGALNASDKTAGRDSHEHGAGANWPNPYEYTGDHTALGVHGTIVARCAANGCDWAYLSGLGGFYAREPLDGGVYVLCSRPCGSQNSPHEFRADGWGAYNPAGGGVDWYNTNRNAVYRGGGGYVRVRATLDTLILESIRTFIPGLKKGLNQVGGPVDDAPDGVMVNKAVIDRYVITRSTKPRALVRAGSGIFPTDRTTPAAAGSTQPDRDPRDPPSVVGEFGERWLAFTQGSDPDNQLMSERASAIDGQIVIATTRPKTAAANSQRQTVCTFLPGLNRIIRVKPRMESAAPTATLGIIGIFCQPENWLTATSGKGLTLRFAGTSAATNLCRLYWDNGSIDALQVISSPDYKCPVSAAFDAGFTIIVRARRVQVFAPVSGVITKIIDHDMGATIYNAIRADATMRYVGMGSQVNNISGQGGVTEFIDFFAKTIVPGG